MFEAEVNDTMVLHCPAVAILKMLHAKSHPPSSQVTVQTIYRRNLTAELFNLFFFF